MTTTITSVNSTTSSQELIAADGSRSSLIIENTDGYRLYMLFGAGTATTTAGGYTGSVPTNGRVSLTPPESYQAINGIWAANGAGAATITAITDPTSDLNGIIETYAELKLSVAAWMKPDTTLPTAETSTRIPEYIALFEAEAHRILRVRDMDATSTALAITTGTATVPAGYRKTLSLRLTDSPYNNVSYLPIDQIERLDPANTDLPFHYDVVDTLFIFYPPTTATARLRYRRGLTPLSADSDTNWLLAKHPDAYLYGALKNADRRLVDPERLGLIEPNYNRVMAQIMAEGRDMHGPTMQMQPSGFVV